MILLLGQAKVNVLHCFPVLSSVFVLFQMTEDFLENKLLFLSVCVVLSMQNANFILCVNAREKHKR